MHSTNYVGTFIVAAEDSVADQGVIPPEKAENPSIASRTWRMIAGRPYAHTSDDVIFTVWPNRQGILEEEREVARREFFAKGQA